MRYSILMLCALLVGTTIYAKGKKGKTVSQPITVSVEVPRNCDFVTDKVVYLYNVTNNAFLCGGNIWGTQTSISKDRGWKAILRKYLDANGVWDGRTVLITDSVEYGQFTGVYRNVYVKNKYIVYTDQSKYVKDNDNRWEIVFDAKDRKQFRILPSDFNRIFTKENMPGYSLSRSPEIGEETVIGLYKGMPDTWTLISEDDYRLYINRNLIREKRHKVSSLVDSIIHKSPDTNIATYKALAEKTSSIDSLNSLIGSLQLRIDNNEKTDSVDFTDKIYNHNFDSIQNNSTGWNYACTEEVNDVLNCGGLDANPCGQGSSSFDINQTVDELPDGLYKVEAQAFNRTDVPLLSWINRDSTVVVPELYADEMYFPLKNVHAERVFDKSGINNIYNISENYESGIERVGTMSLKSIGRRMLDDSYIPDGLVGTSVAFTHGLYNNVVYAYVNSGKLRLGIRQRKTRNGNWTTFDNFRLTYLGDDINGYKKALEQYIRESNSTIALATKRNVDCSALSSCVSKTNDLLQSLNSNKEDRTTLRTSLKDINATLLELRNRLEDLEYADVRMAQYSNDDKPKKVERSPYATADSLLALATELISIHKGNALTTAKKAISEFETVKPEEYPYSRWWRKTYFYADLYRIAALCDDKELEDSLEKEIIQHCEAAKKLDKSDYSYVFSTIDYFSTLGDTDYSHGELACSYKLFDMYEKTLRSIPMPEDSLEYLQGLGIASYRKAFIRDDEHNILAADTLYSKGYSFVRYIYNEKPDKYKAHLEWLLKLIVKFYSDDSVKNTERLFEYGKEWYGLCKQTNGTFADMTLENLATYFNTLAYYFVNEKKYGRAMDAIDFAIENCASEDSFILSNLYDSKGEIYLMSGQKDKALEMWNKAIDLTPDFTKKLEENGNSSNLHNELLRLNLLKE